MTTIASAEISVFDDFRLDRRSGGASVSFRTRLLRRLRRRYSSSLRTFEFSCPY